MSSGLDWNEDYFNPFSQTARVYFDENIREVVLDLKVIDKPGTAFKYLSGNTILLGLVLATFGNEKRRFMATGQQGERNGKGLLLYFFKRPRFCAFWEAF